MVAFVKISSALASIPPRYASCRTMPAARCSVPPMPTTTFVVASHDQCSCPIVFSTVMSSIAFHRLLPLHAQAFSASVQALLPSSQVKAAAALVGDRNQNWGRGNLASDVEQHGGGTHARPEQATHPATILRGQRSVPGQRAPKMAAFDAVFAISLHDVNHLTAGYFRFGSYYNTPLL